MGNGGVDPTYTAYYLGHPLIKDWIVQHALGATMPNLNTSILSSIPFVVPPPKIQRTIAHILGTLDDKIECNRHMNETLEAMARAIFKDWFVDFDPVRAKMEGRQPEGMSAELAALFPDRLDDEGKPEGWTDACVSDLLELAYGKALPATERRAGIIPVYGSGGITGYHDTALVQGPSIVVGRKGTVGSLYWEDSAFYPIDTVFYVRTEHSLSFCFYLLQTMNLPLMNTDAAVPGLNRNNVYRLPIVMPAANMLHAFDEVTSSMREKIFDLSKQSQTLAALRDTLLPKLISGELRIKDAEKFVDEAFDA
jgi:type I restriction enzyme S subunit